MKRNDFRKSSMSFGFEFESNMKANAFYSYYKFKAIHKYKNKYIAA
jgi:hypothetical protein